MKSLGSLARITVRAASYLLGGVLSWRAQVKLVWCVGRVAKLAHFATVDVPFRYPAWVDNVLLIPPTCDFTLACGWSTGDMVNGLSIMFLTTNVYGILNTLYGASPPFYSIAL